MPIKELIATIDPSKVVPVEKITRETLEILRDMVETMDHHNMDYISGPDIGVNQRMLIVNGTFNNFNVVMMINPVPVYDDENKVVVEYNDITGHMQTVILVDKLAADVRSALEELGG